ncbi:MAG TPA: hypothetical protein VF303_04185 [Candidatus Nanoarchaeia archaeon]
MLGCVGVSNGGGGSTLGNPPRGIDVACSGCTGGGGGLGFGGCGAALLGTDGMVGSWPTPAAGGVSAGGTVPPGLAGSWLFVGSVGISAIRNYPQETKAASFLTKVPFFVVVVKGF